MLRFSRKSITDLKMQRLLKKLRRVLLRRGIQLTYLMKEKLTARVSTVVLQIAMTSQLDRLL